jgi:hypothetical protein
MTFPNLPPPPNTSDPSTFSARADAFFAEIPDWSADLSAYGNGISLGFTSVSSTSLTVPTLTAGGTSSVTLTVEASKGFAVGMPVMVVATAALTGARMLGTVSAYNSTTGSLTVVVQHAIGAGSTFAAWRVTLTAPVLSSQLWTLVDTTAGSTIDCGLANYFTRTVSAATTFAFSNAPSGQAYSFTLEVDHVSGVITWPASVVWAFGQTPSLIAGRKHLFVFSTTNGGTLWRGAALSNFTA